VIQGPIKPSQGEVTQQLRGAPNAHVLRETGGVTWLKPGSNVRKSGSQGHECHRPWLAVALVFLIAPLSAQTPEASVRGAVTNSGGQPLVRVEVTATDSQTGFVQTTTTDLQGEYYFGSLPRGLYSFHVEISGYTGLEKRGIELAVGAKHEENFTLSLLPTAQTAISGVFVIVPPAAALPVETIASSVSVVVDENKILELPLASRNIYSLFLLQAGVTSQGAIGTRGLTFSVHGQRVSGSNYQLDGVDNNNIVLTGPVATTSAEAIQEFRMVNSSFSAQNGRATAFVAQVVTRSGSNGFHGSVFEFLGNDKLDANTFENNSNGIAKSPLRQNQFGYSLGGPIQKNKTFFWSGLEFSRLHYGTPMTLQLPSALFIASLPQDSEARRLLTEIPPLAATPVTGGDPNIGQIQIQAPGRIDTLLATERMDHDFTNDKDRLMVRFTVASTASEAPEGLAPGEGFTGYPSLMPTDRYRAFNTMLGWTHSFDASRVNDFRIGWSRERIDEPRPQSGVPILQSFDGVLLPGSPRQSEIGENNNVIQVYDSFSIRRGRSALKLGFEYRRNLSNSLTLGLQNTALGGGARFPDGFYLFNSLKDFGAGQPLAFAIAVDRFSSGQLRLPDLQREYRSNEFAAFVQDDIKLTRRFSLNLGLRYEYYGILHNLDRSKDLNFYFGQGSTIEEQLANGDLRSTVQNSGDLKGLLYRPDPLNFAPSIGIAWDPLGRGRTVLRAGYAIAFDRIFDTLRDLRTNNLQIANCFPPDCPLTFLVPPLLMLPNLNQNLNAQPPGEVAQLDENLRTPYAENWYLGVQQTVTPSLLVETGYAASVGKRLISRDVINRSIQGIQLNHQIGEDTFLSNSGYSNYQALEVGLRRHFSRGLQFQISYTWSHAIDNQSDIFQGPRTGPGPQDFALASFTRQFDAQVDRGNADFDQRHNLVLNAIWDIPTPDLNARWAKWLVQGWTASLIGAHRSGFPITVIGNNGIDINGIANNRLDLIPGQTPLLSHPSPVPGGVQWLNPNAFQLAQSGVGNSGRGAFEGPGSWNYDFALLRSIALTESGIRLQFRAEFYNLFNHANLSSPVSALIDPATLSVNPNFGKAYYGLNQTFSRFGELSLGSPSREIQLALRVEF
jgi:hypothetical protein